MISENTFMLVLSELFRNELIKNKEYFFRDAVFSEAINFSELVFSFCQLLLSLVCIFIINRTKPNTIYYQSNDSVWAAHRTLRLTFVGDNRPAKSEIQVTMYGFRTAFSHPQISWTVRTVSKEIRISPKLRLNSSDLWKIFQKNLVCGQTKSNSRDPIPIFKRKFCLAIKLTLGWMGTLHIVYIYNWSYVTAEVIFRQSSFQNLWFWDLRFFHQMEGPTIYIKPAQNG